MSRKPGPPANLTRRAYNPVGQELLDFYFPGANWVEIAYMGGEFGQAASCKWCGALCIRAMWNNHVQWHTNAIG